jgi:coenzyme F420 hydrogenase subunit beta
VQNIEETVKTGLCTCCGTCAAFCPSDAIGFQESVGGLMLPEVDKTKCTMCGLCKRVCSGTHLEKTARSPQTDPFMGEVVGAYWGRAAELRVFKHGQSGGVVTALLIHLIESGYSDDVVVAQMPGDGSLRPVGVVTHDREEICKAQGSKYCPIPLNASMRDIPSGRRVAVVGLPCHIHGLGNAQSARLKSCPDINLSIGLICDRVLTFNAIDHLIAEAGKNRRDVLRIDYRNKNCGGWPGDVCIHMKDGSTASVPRKTRRMIKNSFTPPRCRLCFDKFNVLSDLVVGDAWGFCKDKEGGSVIVARTKRGKDVLISAMEKGILSLVPVRPEEVFAYQNLENRRSEWTGCMAVWKDEKGVVPDLGIGEDWKADLSKRGLAPYRRLMDHSLSMIGMTDRSAILAAARKTLLRARLFRLPVVKLVVKLFNIRP